MGYFGSKTASGAFQAIIAQMPPHDTYIEPFLGSGVVLLNKPAATRSYGVDLDGRPVIAFDVRAVEGFMSTHQDDAVAFLQHFDWARAGRVLVYADPPYVLASRTSNKRYRHDYTDADHVALIETLRRCPAYVILSGYPSALYDELLPDWRTFTFQVMTRGGPRTDQVWLNFPEGLVQWATFAGEDRTDRQRIKRKAARWAAHYARVPAGERLAVMAAMLEVHGIPRSQDHLQDQVSAGSVDAGDCSRRRLHPTPAQPVPSTLDRSADVVADIYAAGGLTPLEAATAKKADHA